MLLMPWRLLTRGPDGAPQLRPLLCPPSSSSGEGGAGEGGAEETGFKPLFRIAHASEGAFVVGAGGRNTALVRHLTGTTLLVLGDHVYGASPAKAPAKAQAKAPTKAPPKAVGAKTMALSMAAGGVLRWFVTPQATAHGFPPERQEALRALAATHGCALELLRARRGHMCLLLLAAAATAEGGEGDNNDEEDAIRARVRGAREALLAAL